jgi:hypothetical protein
MGITQCYEQEPSLEDAYHWTAEERHNVIPFVENNTHLTWHQKCEKWNSIYEYKRTPASLKRKHSLLTSQKEDNRHLTCLAGRNDTSNDSEKRL